MMAQVRSVKFSFVEEYFLLSIIFGYYLANPTNCQQILPIALTESYYFDDANFQLESHIRDGLQRNTPQQPTPPLESILNSKFIRDNDRTKPKSSRVIISPSKLYKRYVNQHEPEIDMFSPIFQSQYMAQYNNLNFYSENLINSGNNFDLIEPGSGMDPFTWEDTNSFIDDSSTKTEVSDTLAAISPTPTLSNYLVPNTPSGPFQPVTSNDNKPPVLNKRLPKLALTAGRVWRYFIPSDTFIDEDGDLTKLKTSISPKKVYTDNLIVENSIGTNASQLNNHNDYYLWLQYDSNSLLLYGLPTENEAGKHEFVFTVTDRFGLISEEIIEINVRQHQSTRAFTHLFVIDKIEWTRHRFPSMVDAIGEFVKRISTLVYQEQPFRNFIVQNYIINDNNQQQLADANVEQTSNSNLSFSLAWSNSSMPIYPCNMSQIEYITRYIINDQILNYDWNLERGNRVNLVPSLNLIKALAPDFIPTSVSIYLQGTCSDKEKSRIVNSTESILKVKNKIGQLNWKLGEIIEFKIPEGTFSLGEEILKNSELSLSVHTIDAVELDKDIFFDFLEFEQDGQTVYGIPYDQDTHTGQRELILTAIHKVSEQIIREVFIISIEPQDLTTFNNRAFKMSLYFTSRTISFGPKERVQLAHKMVGGLKSTRLTRELQSQEMIVISIQRFSTNNSNSDRSKSGDLNYEEKVIKVPDTAIDQPVGDHQQNSIFPNEQSYLYKFTWTNSSIGYKGDCPVEVINQDILGALKSSMEVFHSTNSLIVNQEKPNSSELLRLYFEPEIDLILLRFEPIGACFDALKAYDVGLSSEGDDIDRAEYPEGYEDYNQEVSTASIITTTTPNTNLEDPDNDVYWSIVLLLILVVAVIYTIITLALGIHTFYINQDKRHRFQVGLAQARQNSMFLSNMILTNQANAFDMNGQILPTNSNKSPYLDDEEKVSRKPVILDHERGLLATTTMIPTAVQLANGTIHTTPIKHSYSTLGPGITWRPEMSLQTMQPTIFENQQSMTLNRRSIGYIQQPTTMNHSQSILTVGSLANPITILPQGQVPIAYSQVPFVASGHLEQQSQPDYLVNRFNTQRAIPIANIPHNTNQIPYNHTFESNGSEQINPSNKIYAPKGQVNRLNLYNNRSPSYSSSTSATTQSIISVQNVGKQRSEI